MEQFAEKKAEFMKKVFVFVVYLFGILPLFAQDLITTKKGEDIQATILEVSTKEVKYKKYNNPDGPTFVLNKSDIVMVRYENGEKDIFGTEASSSPSNHASGEIREGMKYKEYKKLYDTKYYVHEIGDEYSPGWAGVASFFIPGLGQGVAGEWGRAAAIIGGDVALSVAFYLLGSDESTAAIALVPLIGLGVLDIWSIIDAVHIAKVKNMYYQDIRSQRASLDVKLTPYFACTSTNVSGGLQPAAGLSLRVSF